MLFLTVLCRQLSSWYLRYFKNHLKCTFIYWNASVIRPILCLKPFIGSFALRTKTKILNRHQEPSLPSPAWSHSPALLPSLHPAMRVFVSSWNSSLSCLRATTSAVPSLYLFVYFCLLNPLYSQKNNHYHLPSLFNGPFKFFKHFLNEFNEYFIEK